MGQVPFSSWYVHKISSILALPGPLSLSQLAFRFNQLVLRLGVFFHAKIENFFCSFYFTALFQEQGPVSAQ